MFDQLGTHLDQIPLWLKLTYTAFLCLLVPVNWMQYGLGNFLWFSDVALLMTAPALWLESPLLASMPALAVVLLDSVWVIDFVIRVVGGVSLIGVSSYMFDPKIPRAVRAVSLFHIALPVLLVWMIYRLGYDSRALLAQTLLAWIVLLLSYLLTKPSENVNRVYGFGDQPQTRMPAPLFLALQMVLFPIVVYVPSHLVFRALFA